MPERSGAGPVIHDRPLSLGTDERQLPVYDGPIGLRLLYEDPLSGEEHYLVRYPAGLKAQWHRHTAAHTLVVLEGRLEVNGSVVGPGAYCHYPPATPMHHAPAGDEPCAFLLLFHGPFDVEALGDTPGTRAERPNSRGATIETLARPNTGAESSRFSRGVNPDASTHRWRG